MFPHHICENIDIIEVMTVQKNNFGFHSNRKNQEHKHQLNNLYFKYQICKMRLRHLNTFLQFRLLFHEPHCRKWCLLHFFVKYFKLPRYSGYSSKSNRMIKPVKSTSPETYQTGNVFLLPRLNIFLISMSHDNCGLFISSFASTMNARSSACVCCTLCNITIHLEDLADTNASAQKLARNSLIR